MINCIKKILTSCVTIIKNFFRFFITIIAIIELIVFKQTFFELRIDEYPRVYIRMISKISPEYIIKILIKKEYIQQYIFDMECSNVKDMGKTEKSTYILVKYEYFLKRGYTEYNSSEIVTNENILDIQREKIINFEEKKLIKKYEKNKKV